MRRRTRLGFATIAALLMAVAAYTAFWFVAAGRIESGFADWAQSAKADKLDFSWQKIRIDGYPAAFHVRLASVVARDDARTPTPEFHVPVLSATARPWNFADWRLAMRNGLTAELTAAGARPPARLVAQTADGLVSIERSGGWRLRLRIRDSTLEAGAPIRAELVDATVSVPSPTRGNGEPVMGLAVDASHIGLPVPIGPLGDMLDELHFAVAVKGALPSGNLADAVAEWRDAGGTIELENLRLKWGPLGATAAGTVSLDQDLQPTAEISGTVRGYDEILTTFVENGQMRAVDAALARIVLKVLAKPGPDGEPEINATFRLQNSQMFLGPVKLGSVPRLAWR